EEQNKKQREEIIRLKSELEKIKIKSINLEVNKPSSKKPEWDKKGVGNDGKGNKKKGKGRGRRARKGAGNVRKDKKITRSIKTTVDTCDNCDKDLTEEPALQSSNERIVEDIPDIVRETVITSIEQEKKCCPNCKAVVTAKSILALPKADIGLNASVLICYFWVALSMPLTRTRDYLQAFFSLKLSTSGLSKHVIRIAEIMKPVYHEILKDIKSGVTLHADETGWRVRGKNWWLWVFGTLDSAYFTIDKSRGSAVVRRVLGEIFFGVLVVDGWSAYLSLICEQQSCMAHVLRKIRKFRESFPHLKAISQFYFRFRKILRDGEKLQSQRKELEKLIFKRRLKKLHDRLNKLLEWQDPDDILKEIIKKVKRQQPRILTFVDHPGVPCHNNYGEYLIRIGVLKRIVSGGSVSSKGAEAYAVLLSIFITCKLRGIGFPMYLKTSLQQYIKTGKPMLLKEYNPAEEMDLAA
ncbi:IS66 family transposase, partial [Desulfobacula sp.]|uniref:IS66 family transposase n=1 Tax=Desulfobacula sp. TaxID=2593537 RepID=UPI002628CB66